MKNNLLLVLILLSALTLRAQQNMTLYQMHDIPQSNNLNPAVAIPCGWIIGIPVVGNISAGAYAPMSYNSLGAGQDVLPVNDVISNLHNKNVLAVQGSLNLITVGYRKERSYYQLTINERVSGITSISKDPIEMLLKGNAGYIGQTVSGEPLADAVYYREFAFNYAREIDPSLWIGVRPKLLFGRLGIKSTNNTADFYTDPMSYDLRLTSNILARMSVPGTVTMDPVTGKVSDFEPNINLNKFMFSFSNFGAGVDLGIIKQFDNDWELSASLLNVGVITWSKNVRKFSQSGTLNFTGPYAPVNEYDALIDEIKSFARLDYTEEKFTQMLTPVVMVGANRPLNEYIKVGLTGMVEVQTKTLPWAITATAFSSNLQTFDLGLSYTVTPYSYFNVGIGIGAHLGVVGVHFTTDNIIGLFKPFDANYATFQFGLNLRLGCNNSPSKKIKGYNYLEEYNPNRNAVPCSRNVAF